MTTRYLPDNIDLTHWSYVTIGFGPAAGLSRHGGAELVPVAGGGRAADAPGGLVRHTEDRDSFGMIVAVSGDGWHVLWSKPPVLASIPNVNININVETIDTPSRQLKAQWAVEETVADSALFNKELLEELRKEMKR